jgi:4-carboxymuconolactone decarboxylase
MPERVPRIAPLQAPYPPGVQEMLAKWMPPASDAEPLRLFRTLAVHAELMSRMRPLGSGILGARATVPPQLREIVIHRTCALTRAQYEWGVHALAFGAPLGLSETQLRSTVHGHWSDACWQPEQTSVFRLADELHQTSALSDELWLALAARFEDMQIIELIVTAGWYHVIGYLCNGLAVQDEEWGRAFPAADAHGAGIVSATD